MILTQTPDSSVLRSSLSRYPLIGGETEFTHQLLFNPHQPPSGNCEKHATPARSGGLALPKSVAPPPSGMAQAPRRSQTPTFAEAAGATVAVQAGAPGDASVLLAGEAARFGGGGDAGPYRIEIDIAHARQQRACVLEPLAPEASFPEAPGALVIFKPPRQTSPPSAAVDPVPTPDGVRNHAPNRRRVRTRTRAPHSGRCSGKPPPTARSTRKRRAASMEVIIHMTTSRHQITLKTALESRISRPRSDPSPIGPLSDSRLDVLWVSPSPSSPRSGNK